MVVRVHSWVFKSYLRNKEMSILRIKITKKQDRSLQKMADNMKITKARVLQKGLALLQVVLEESKNENKISVTKDDKIIKEIVGF